MGFILFVGVMMGICLGNFDLVLILFIMEKMGKIVDEVLEIFNKELGLLGFIGILSDLCDLIEEVKYGC